jgi:non-lysosomal glucosylceramidase
MIYEGMQAEGLKCIQSIRDRFDGQKRNPFDEPECGHHYARAMASWSAVLALTGFQYSGIEQTFQVKDQVGQYFWSTGYSWGTYQVQKQNNKTLLKIEVEQGKLELKRLIVGALPPHGLKTPKTINPGEHAVFNF